ncbi:MAG TPA: DMT family transporter [Anaeromyxobacteraceae bacterium]|nr:DMT family transporter [Anaeromyxobacteraceae bacterium]
MKQRPALLEGAPGRASARAQPSTGFVQANPPSTDEDRPSRTKLYALLLLLLLIWSINYVIAKAAVRDAPAFLVVCLRTMVSGGLMAGWATWLRSRPRAERRRKPRPRPTLHDLPRLLAIGAGGIVGNQALFVVGLALTSVAHGAILAALTPILVLLGSAAIGTEALTRRKLVGGVLALLGVVVLQLARAHAATAPGVSQATLAGDLVVLASTVLFAGFAVFGKRAASEFGATTLNVVGYVGGAALLLPFTVWQVLIHPLTSLTPTAWLGVAFMGTCPSLAGYLIYAHALKWLPASRVATISYLQPLLATAFAVLLLGERPGVGFFAATALVVAGVWVAQRPSTPARRAPAADVRR